MPNAAKRTAREVNARERQKKVLELRLRGTTYAEIGKHLGISDVMVLKLYRRALAAIPAAEAAQERKSSLQRIESNQLLLNSKIQALRDSDEPEDIDRILRLTDGIRRWEERRAALLGLDMPKQVVIEDQMSIQQVRSIMEAARERHPPEEAPRYVTPEIEHEPIRQLEAPQEPEPAVDAEYVDIQSLREAAAAKQKRLDEIHEFEVLVSSGRAIPPQLHPSGRPWLEGERRLPWHLVPGFEHLPKQAITLTSSPVQPDERTKDFYGLGFGLIR